MLHPEIKAVPFPEWVGPKAYIGHEGFRRLSEEWTETFESYSWEVEQITDAGDQVVALIYHRGQIKGTDVPLRQPIGAVWGDFRVGGPAEARFLLSWDEALEAAGLSE
jgi:hypothetical protein